MNRYPMQEVYKRAEFVVEHVFAPTTYYLSDQILKVVLYSSLSSLNKTQKASSELLEWFDMEPSTGAEESVKRAWLKTLYDKLNDVMNEVLEERPDWNDTIMVIKLVIGTE